MHSAGIHHILWPLLPILHLGYGYINDVSSDTTCSMLSADDILLLPQICPATQISQKSTDSVTNKPSAWLKGDVCHYLGSDEVCSFTHPEFNDGLGVTLITTAGRLEGVSAFPAMSGQGGLQKSAPGAGGTQPDQGEAPYQDEFIHGKGIGLVATREIKAGELIIARTPTVLVDDEAFTDLGAETLTILLVEAIGNLPQQHQIRYMNLSTHDAVESDAERIYQVFVKNNFRVRLHNIIDFHATFVDGTLSSFSFFRFSSSSLYTLSSNVHY